jgi:hypothetical protein
VEETGDQCSHIDRSMIRIAGSVPSSVLSPLSSPAGKSDPSQEAVFVPGDDGEILGIAMGTVWERNRNDGST